MAYRYRRTPRRQSPVQADLGNIARPVRVYAVGTRSYRPITYAGHFHHLLASESLPLPFLVSDPRQDYFLDGVTEPLTTDLSRLCLFMIARDAAFRRASPST